MFTVDEATATAIRHAWNEGGELLVVVELCRRFPAITDGADARRCVGTIVSWTRQPDPGDRERPASDTRRP